VSSDGTDDREPRTEGGFPPPPPAPQPGQAQTPAPAPAPGQAPFGQQPQAPFSQPSAPVFGQQPPYGQPAQQAPAGQPAQQPYPYPGQPGAQQPPAGGQPPKKGLGRGAIIGIVVAAVVVLAVIIGAILLITRLVGSPAADGGGEEGGTTATTPAAVVEGYLEALADSDAKTALSFVDEVPSDSPFLTDDVLAASNELAPLTDIVVTEPTDADFSTSVTATYSLGDVPVTTEFSVNEYDADDVWKLTAVTADLDFGDRFAGLDMTLNGEPLESSSAEVFPGTYELATTTPNFEVTGTTAITVREPFDYPSLSDTSAALTADGVLVFRQAVKDSVAACVAATTFVAGCGIDVPQVLSDGSLLAEGTLVRSLRAETQAKLDNLQPQPGYGDPLVVTGEYIGGISVTASLEGGGSGDLLFGPSLGSPVVDFTSGTPVVTWD